MRLPQCSASRRTGKSRMASRRSADISRFGYCLSSMLLQFLQNLLELPPCHGAFRMEPPAGGKNQIR